MYLAWTATGTTQNDKEGADIYFSRSTDGGETWSDPFYVNTDSRSEYRDQFYSSIAVSDDGVVIISYWDGRNNEDNRSVWYFMTYSFDGGESFIPEFYVSQDSTNFQTVGMQRTFGIGEYNQVVASKGHAIPVWADGRKGNGDLDIYAAVVPIGKKVAGIKELQNITKSYNLNLYPNPATKLLSLDFNLLNQAEVSYKIISEEGKIIQLQELGSYPKGVHSISIDIDNLPAANYKFMFQTKDGIEIKSFLKVE